MQVAASKAAEAADHHVIVVGSGAAGGWAAKELCEGGLRVLLLEAGRAIEEGRDFKAFPTGTLHMPTRLSSALRGQHIQARGPNFSADTRDFYVNDREHPYSHPRGKPFYWLRGRQVGGRLHTWCRAMVRMSDAELRPSLHGSDGPDWPISYQDLEPYYDRVEAFLGLLGMRSGVPGLMEGRYSGSMPLTETERRFLDAAGKNGGPVRVAPGRMAPHSPVRIPLTILAAQRTGNLTLRSDAAVSRILVDAETGRANGVAYVDAKSGSPREARARVVVLCASAFESVRILLNSASPRHPGGIGNSSDLLGRHIADHLMIGLRGPLPEGAWVPEPSRGGDPFDFGVTGLYLLATPTPGAAKNLPRKTFGIQCGMGGNSPWWWMLAFQEMSIRPENRLTIDAARTDLHGIPIARIDCGHDAEDRERIAAMRATMMDFAERNRWRVVMPQDEPGARGLAFRLLRKIVFTPGGAFWPGTAIHEIGGARMGTSPRDSVLNPNNQCWDAPNVFVCDGSCFVRPGYQSHTLTIKALTIRACDFILAAARRGEL